MTQAYAAKREVEVFGPHALDRHPVRPTIVSVQREGRGERFTFKDGSELYLSHETMNVRVEEGA